MKSSLSSHAFPWEPVEHKATDNRQTGLAVPLFLSLSSSLSSIREVSVSPYLLMTLVPLIWLWSGKLVSLLTAT